MLPQMPAPSFTQLDPAPLELVVCQVRHEQLSFPGQEAWFAVHAELHDTYPIIEPHVVHDLALNVGPHGIQAAGEPQRGFRLKSADEAWTVALLPQFFALESTGYTSWTDFNSRFERLVDAVERSLSPKIEQRLGLRFVDQLHGGDAAGIQRWSYVVDSAVAGVLNHPVLGPRVRGLESTFQIREGDFDVLVRHGAAPEAQSYVIDTDCVRQGGRMFERHRVLADTQALHSLALQVFQSCLRPEYLGSLQAKK